MSERDTSPHSQDSSPSERIGITYSGILAEKMDWQRGILGQFERASNLRTAVEITNNGDRDEYDAVGMGDTLALRRIGKIQDLFIRRSVPRRFLAVETNLSTAKSRITINDQAIASEVLKDGGRLNEAEFTVRVNKLVKEGLKAVLSTEKKHQLGTSLRVYGACLVVFMPGVPGMAFLIDNLGLSANNSIPMSLGAIGASVGLQIGKRIGLPMISKIEEKLMRESNFAYIEDFTDIFNFSKYLADLRRGRRFLGADKNKVIIPKQ